MGCAGVRRRRPRAEIQASRTHLRAPRPQICRGRAPGAGGRSDAADPGPGLCGSRARAAPPCRKAPHVISQFSESGAEAALCCSPGPWPPAAAGGDPGPGRSIGVAPCRQPSAATPAGAVGRGSPVCAAELHARGSGPGSYTQDPPDCKTLEQKLGGSAGRFPSVLQVQLPLSLLRRDPALGPACRWSRHSPALISAAACSRAPRALLQPDAPARRCRAQLRDSPSFHRSAAQRTAAPARSVAAASSRAGPAPPAPPPSAPPPAVPPLSAPAALRAGRTLGSVGAATPALRLHAAVAAPTDCKSQLAARPAHAQTDDTAAAVRSHSRACGAVTEASLAAWLVPALGNRGIARRAP